MIIRIKEIVRKGAVNFALKVDQHRQEVGSGHEHGVAICNRFAVQEVRGSGARDFCFSG